MERDMASRGINKVILVGNLGGDPEVRYLPNGSAVANITLATSESWKDKNTGEQRDKTEWHRVTLYGKLAEIAGEYLKKGSQVYVEGQLQTRKWQDQSGQDRYSTEVVVQGYNGTMQMIGGRATNNQQPQFNSPNMQQQSMNSSANNSFENSAPKKQENKPDFDESSFDFDDDIPF